MKRRKTNELILFDFPGSPCARRVKITMIEKGLTWENIIVDLSRMEQKNPAYLAINPNGKVPTLRHNGRTLIESNDITKYLDDVFPDTLMYPTEEKECVQVTHWQRKEAEMALDYRPLMYQRIMGPLLRLTLTLDEALERAKLSTNRPEDLEWERKVWSLEVVTQAEQTVLESKLYAWLDDVEKALTGKQYLVGNRFGQSEISLYPRIDMLPWVGIKIYPTRYPNIIEWMNRLSTRKSFKKSRTNKDSVIGSLSKTPLFPFLARTLPYRQEADFQTRMYLYTFEKIASKIVNSPASKISLEERLESLSWSH